MKSFNRTKVRFQGLAQNSTASQRVSLWPWVYVFALVYLALHLVTSTRYGYFRDALYYLACSETEWSRVKNWR